MPKQTPHALHCGKAAGMAGTGIPFSIFSHPSPSLLYHHLSFYAFLPSITFLPINSIKTKKNTLAVLREGRQQEKASKEQKHGRQKKTWRRSSAGFACHLFHCCARAHCMNGTRLPASPPRHTTCRRVFDMALWRTDACCLLLPSRDGSGIMTGRTRAHETEERKSCWPVSTAGRAEGHK